MIKATEVSEHQRLGFLPLMLGTRYLDFENRVYGQAREFTDQYKGGYWSFYQLNNGSFYIAPAGQQRWSIYVWGNGFKGELSSDAFGVVVSLFALNTLIWEDQSDDLIDKYYLLRDFAAEHPEGASIMRAID